MEDFLRELKGQEEKLFHCVHCGFCLPACPTYVRLGDEADSPRGRLHFMRALVEGRIDPDSLALNLHLDRCLGCRACETVCPSGVEYGRILEAARTVTREAAPSKLLARLLPKLMASPGLLSPLMFLARILRDTGIPRVVAQRLPKEGIWGQAGLGLGMIAATSPSELLDRGHAFGGSLPSVPGSREERAGGERPAISGAKPSKIPGSGEGRNHGTLGGGARTGILVGCVQDGLLRRVNEATRRVLEANGFRLVEVEGQGCCGALHAHTGEMTVARDLARKNIRAFEALDLDVIAVNAAGCGAVMKEYPHLLESDGEFRERAHALASRVRDVSELLGRPGLRRGGSLELTVTYDAPCHLLHAQRIWEEPVALLRSIPGLTLIPLRGEEECCGGAGIYGITHPELGGRISGDKLRAILDTGAQLVATGNPGCMMQIGAALATGGRRVDVAHPIELLDESYRRGGIYS